MKIYISNYRYHWISPYTIIEYVLFWTDWSKCGRNKGVIADKDYVDHPKWVDRWADRIQPISTAIRVVLDFIHPPIKYVKIDRWDTWSMDHTLAHIILPMLKQLDKEKHGAPYTNDEDVPEWSLKLDKQLPISAFALINNIIYYSQVVPNTNNAEWGLYVVMGGYGKQSLNNYAEPEHIMLDDGKLPFKHICGNNEFFAYAINDFVKIFKCC